MAGVLDSRLRGNDKCVKGTILMFRVRLVSHICNPPPQQTVIPAQAGIQFG